MSPTRNYTIKLGASWSRTYIKRVNGVPLDLTGCTARLQMRASAAAAEVVKELSTTNGGIVLGGALGSLTPALTPSDAVGLTAQTVVFDIRVQFPNGLVDYDWPEGRITFITAVTR